MEVCRFGADNSEGDFDRRFDEDLIEVCRLGARGLEGESERFMDLNEAGRFGTPVGDSGGDLDPRCCCCCGRNFVNFVYEELRPKPGLGGISADGLASPASLPLLCLFGFGFWPLAFLPTGKLSARLGPVEFILLPPPNMTR